MQIINPSDYKVFQSLAYATNDNFTSKKIYKREVSFLHPNAAEALSKAIRIAASLSLKFRIYDAFRPIEAQKIMWSHTPNPSYVADPNKGSPHSRGIAIDLTLCKFDGQNLEMGTKFDSFTEKSHHGYLNITKEEQINRNLLLGIMTASGWDFYDNEWWHYQLFDSKSYPLLSDKAAGTNLI